MSGDEFDWNESLVVARQDAIAVYLNVNGDIVIRQGQRYPDDDSLVVLNVEHAERLIAAIRRAVSEAENG